MAYQLFRLPKAVGLDSAVRALSGAKAYFYETGTTTPQDTYSDAELTTPHAHPVVADASGVFPPIYLDPSRQYKLTLNNSADVLIYTVDPVNDRHGVSYDRTAAEIAAGVTPTDYSYPAGNVRRYGAVGDGSTDDTAAFNLAAKALADGGWIYVPPGDYIIDSGCWLIRGKSHVRIYGDGEVSKVRVSGQTDSNPVKQDWHTTMAVDECSYVTVENLCIESRGQNYGNTDAYGSLSGGDDRTNAIIENGGSALLVSRSDNVTLRNVIARRCGSVAVVYLSACEEVVVENCFANARSLGYAGFAADNWAHSTIKTKRTYKFVNCRVSKEDATYSAKAGILTEGDEVTGRLLNVEVSGGIFEDISIGGDAKLWGAAVGGQETRLIVTGITAKNCYQGIRWEKRGGAVDATWLHVAGCNLINNKVTGIYINVGTATGGARMSITGTRIVTNSTSVWDGGDEPAVAVSSGIACGSIQGADICYITGCNISGAQHGIYAINNSKFELAGSRISALDGGVTMYGGGILNIEGGAVTTSESGSIPVYMNTANLEETTGSTIAISLVGVLLSPAGDTTSDYAAQIAGNSTLFSTIRVRNNIVTQGIINIAKGSASVYDVDEVMLNTTRRVVAHGLTGSDTYVEVNLPKEYLPTYAYAVGSDGTARAVQSVTANQGGTRGLVRVRLSGDVRTHYDSANNARVTLMQ